MKPNDTLLLSNIPAVSEARARLLFPQLQADLHCFCLQPQTAPLKPCMCFCNALGRAYAAQNTSLSLMTSLFQPSRRAREDAPQTQPFSSMAVLRRGVEGDT